MMRSLFAGVSGLTNHQTRMDVIGNNISNVNTYGYKTSRVTFQDMLSQTIAGAARPDENRGGVNPRQVGLGMKIASIDKIFTQGSVQTTGNQTDMAISGDGFFIVSEGEKNFYTRSGAFGLDRDGMLVNPGTGLRVQGWMAARNAAGEMAVETNAQTEDIVIPVYSKVEARETTEVLYKCNLDSKLTVVPAGADDAFRAQNSVTTAIDVYDNKGDTHRLTMTFWKTGTNQWSASADVTGADSPVILDVPGRPGAENEASTGNIINLTFSPDGRLISAGDAAGPDELNEGILNASLGFRIAGDPEVRNINLNLGEAGLISGITQFSSPSTTKAVEQNGYSMGYMESFNIDDSGTVTGVYSNGMRQTLAQVALAVFNNPQGLTAAGDNTFEASNNSGMANVGAASEVGRGKIVSGSLEMSNVDLAGEFTDMIITQRGFQANSRTITTSDQMLQELINLKR